MKYSHPLYSVQSVQKGKKLCLHMQVNQDILYTSAFPNIREFLRCNAPKVLKTQCFNPQKLSFAREVLNTEMAHLFEHILLQNLCDECIISGQNSACFRADTEWDWDKNPRGNFTITVYSSVEKKWLEPALKNTIQLTNTLLNQLDRN